MLYWGTPPNSGPCFKKFPKFCCPRQRLYPPNLAGQCINKETQRKTKRVNNSQSVASSNSKAAMMDREDGGGGGGGGPTATPRPRKGMGLRTWLVVSESGQSRVEEVGKHVIMRRTGLPARDLRVLDPLLSYPSSILGRERAIVINLEHIKAIVTAKEVLMLYSTNPLVVQFVQDLQHRISSLQALSTQQAGERDEMEREDKAEANLSGPSQHTLRRRASISSNERKDDAPETSVVAGPKVLAFEFRALESCLESACRCLDSETRTLEEEAYPALDELTTKISTLNLERVRQIKSRLVAINGRVQKVRDEIEHLLDDDNDMAEMYLTEKLNASKEEVSDEDDDRSENNSQNFTSFKPNVEELEMLLEAYFAQIDGILQKLSDMSEYVDDTEDCINIMLDDTQNQLLQMGVLLSAANMILNAGIVVVGLFGMNIHITLFDAPTIKFWQTTC
ncbi:hypothetical protein CICLE_v10027569mg, partial [Citrus x clementina]